MRPDVQRWLARRTSGAADWSLERALAAKGSTRVSVVIPALNEEATIGAIVQAIRCELMQPGGRALVDELIVMDSGCTDATAARARAAGAQVVHRDDVVCRLPAGPGKGEVLWRSLAATTGDLLVFVDADLRSFRPDYVVGLVAPLLTDPTLSLVKAVYDRRLVDGGSVLSTGGGRVTELVARPLLNLHWPELAGVVQPLAGEYAARRSLLETLSFPTGYGIELGVLIDTLRVAGLDAIGQVDLGVREHRHHDDARLGLMAAEIWQVAISRLVREGRLRLRDALNPTLAQFERVDGWVVATTQDVQLIERPPMLSIPEYAARRRDQAS